MKTLKITKEISIPISAVTETFAAIGRRGAGKSYLSMLIAEQMLDAEAQVVVMDPVGIWWGLRVGADGRSKGKEIFVIGGEHGDVPLVPEAGKRIAQLIIEKNISAVVDVSGFRIGEHKRFAADFAEEFFQLKKTRKTPVHFFVEEAQTLIPQRFGSDEARMVGAFERIVRLGRNYGIGCTLVTQRPQSVNKEVLSQVECLFVLQITGLHERKALEDWVQEKGADRKLVGELPSLKRGEGYIWSPAFLRIYKRVNFSKKETFDASATPEVGKETKRASLSTVDVEKLRKDMADVVAKAEQDDPAALRRKIKELEIRKPMSDPRAFEKAVQQAVAKKEKEISGDVRRFESEINRLNTILTQIVKIAGGKGVQIPKFSNNTKTYPQKMQVIKKPYVSKEVRSEIERTDTELTRPEQRILNAISWLNSIGIEEPNKTAVAFLAGYTFGSGAFNNPCGSLRSKGLVDYRTGNKIVLTSEGDSLAEPPQSILTQEELHEKVLSVLENPHQRVLKPLLEAYPNAITNEELAELSGYTFGSGAFNNPKGRLRSLGLIEYPAPNQVKASDILFF